MGWVTTCEYERCKEFYTVREYLDRRFACDRPEFPRFEILDSALIRNAEYYAAVRRTDRATGEKIVFALIAEVSYKPSDPEGHTLGWKDMSETSHPFLYNCPQRILDLLDPTENENALAWRKECHAVRERIRASRKTFVHGAVVEFEQPLRFAGGIHRSRFTVERQKRKLRFRAEDGTLCRIPSVETISCRVTPPVS